MNHSSLSPWSHFTFAGFLCHQTVAYVTKTTKLSKGASFVSHFNFRKFRQLTWLLIFSISLIFHLIIASSIPSGSARRSFLEQNGEVSVKTPSSSLWQKISSGKWLSIIRMFVITVLLVILQLTLQDKAWLKTIISIVLREKSLGFHYQLQEDPLLNYFLTVDKHLYRWKMEASY